MAYENDILTRNDNDELAVRTVQSVGDNPASSYDDVYTRDNNGKLAVRVVGGEGGGSSYTAGTGIDITSGVISVTGPTLQNTATGTDSLTILGTPATSNSGAINIGSGSSATGDGIAIGKNSTSGKIAIGTNANCGANGFMAIGKDAEAGTFGTAIGESSKATGNTALAIGYGARATAGTSIAIGNASRSTANYAIQIGGAGVTNSEANTMKIGLGSLPAQNYKLLDSDGTIPADRLVHAINKYSTMPTAASTNEGWIVQFTGTTDSTYTHGHLYECVSDGGNPATYSWTEVSMGGGSVSSVNNQTGAVVLNASDVGAIPQYSSMPEPNQAGDIVQYTGTTNQNYTKGYFYKSGVSGTEIVDGNCTITSYENGEGQDPGSQYYPTFVFDKSVFDAYLVSQSATANTGTSITFDLATDDDTGDNLLVAHYNTNDSVSTMLIDVEGNGLNQTYAILGFTTNFADPEEDPETADQQVILVDAGHITVSLPTENTYGWERIDVQPTPVIPDPLPSQTGNSGKFLTTDGTDASWSDKPLVNTATQTESLNIGGGTYGDPYYQMTTVVGSGATARGDYCTSYGRMAKAFERATAIGGQASSYSQYSSSFGWGAAVGYSTIGAIQLGNGTNSTPGTFSVGLTTDGNIWGNYELLSADGTIPTDRYTTTPVADGTYVPTLTISSGVATRSWAAPGGGGGSATATTATLAANAWSSNSQTVNVTGVTSSNIVFVMPAPATQGEYNRANIQCSAQGSGVLTFTCGNVPTTAITVNIIIM